MAQKRFTTYKASVESFPLGEANVGILKPGRYNGFDSMSTSDNISVTISHTGLVPKTDTNNAQVVFGALFMPTGIVIHEDESVILNMPSTSSPGAGDPTTRNFLVVCEHNYQQVKGGVEANYLIIANPTFGTGVPSLTNPATQVAIGVITKDYSAGTLSYAKKVNPIAGDMTDLELYKLIEKYIPKVELPDFDKIVQDYILANQPRTIITPTFDLADDSSIPNWTTVTKVNTVGQQPGHDLESHIVTVKQTRLGSGNAALDVDIKNDGASSSWEWGNAEIIGLHFLNNQDTGQPLWAPLEIRNKVVTSNGGSVRRFQLGEGNSGFQQASLRIVLKNNQVLSPTGSGGTSGQEFITSSKSSVEVNSVYPYPQSVKISSSGPWVATSDNPKVTVSPSSGQAGDTTVSIMINESQGYVEGLVTFALSNSTKIATVLAKRQNGGYY